MKTQLVVDVGKSTAEATVMAMMVDPVKVYFNSLVKFSIKGVFDPVKRYFTLKSDLRMFH